MDQVKTGKCISQCRKDKNLTQAQLAEKFNITARAVSKQETGRACRIFLYILDVCREPGISVSELSNGEMIKTENYDKKAEENFVKLQKEKKAVTKDYCFPKP